MNPTAATAHSQVPKERLYFKELLLANHFAEGYVPAAATTYEELTCVSYQPQLKRLDAVVAVKQDAGYGGGICTEGSQEYVTFYTSTDGGTSWTDQGTVSFTVWDTLTPKPLEFEAALMVDLEQECCKEANLVLVRAVLSWGVPAAGPSGPLVWGNAVDATIQVAPIQQGSIASLLQCLELKVPIAEVGAVVDPGAPVEFAYTGKPGPAELHKAYAATKVPQHRYLMPVLQDALAQPATLAASGSSLLDELDVDIANLIGVLLDPQGDESYEQLGCVGLNESTSELVATVEVKEPAGYSGNLCTAGSQEYVAFWVDWQDGSGLQYAGTSSVAVHDIASIPAGGLHYSVVLPFPQVLSKRQPCADGPKTALIRTVLSWSTPPSSTDPYAVPVWGGHLEALILIPSGIPVTGGGVLIESLGSVAVGNIDDTTGLATGPSVVGFTAFESPFGGSVNIAGYVLNPATDLPGGTGYRYRVMTSSDGINYSPLTAPFTVTTMQLPSGTQSNVSQTPDTGGWVPYLANLSSGPPFVTVVGNILGYVSTAGNGRLWIYVEAQDALSNPIGASVPKLIQLDNQAPSSTIEITSGGGSCGDFTVGDTISGLYSSTDNEALAGVGFSVEPSLYGGVFGWSATATSPASQSGTWTLDTKGMEPCGYVVRIDGSDRTIVNSGTVGWDGPAFTGFCLKG